VGVSSYQEYKLAGSAVLTPDGIHSQITATEAADLCGVALCTITKWVREERIRPVGINRQGRKLYLLLDVAKAELATRNRAGRAAA
jgi:predicted site-specific integrase-resolvase